MQGNGILFRAFLVLVLSAGVWMQVGLSIGRGTQGAFMWPYILPSLIFIALIMRYRVRVRRCPAFPTKARTMLLLTAAWISCAAGVLLSLSPI